MIRNRKVWAVVFSFILSVLFTIPAFAITADDVPDCDGFEWEYKDKQWVCLDEHGDPVKGWAIRDDAFYYFDKSGTMKTGWVKYKEDGNWYYFYQEEDIIDEEDIGKMAVDAWIDNYKVNEDGIMIKQR